MPAGDLNYVCFIYSSKITHTSSKSNGYLTGEIQLYIQFEIYIMIIRIETIFVVLYTYNISKYHFEPTIDSRFKPALISLCEI